MSPYRISFVGLGYVGLSTAVCFATRGFHVYGVDMDENKLSAISKGVVPFYERNIDELLDRAIKNRSLIVTPDLGYAVSHSDITFITVGTPSKDDGSVDLSYVTKASEDIGNALRTKYGYHLVVVKSTVPPGTTSGIVRKIITDVSNKTSREIGIAFNPEFLREGTAVMDTFNPDLVVIGTDDKLAEQTLLSLYDEFYDNKAKYYITTPSNAEMIKYAVNSFRATQLSFLNMLANLCETIEGADILGVIKGFSQITKVDQRYLRPGIGFGGSCLPKDVKALLHQMHKSGVDPSLLQSTLQTNTEQYKRIFNMINAILGDMKGRSISVLGLAFKANTDDIRESVAIKLVKLLYNAGAKVSVYDPRAMENARRVLPVGVRFARDVVDCIVNSECCVIATEWDEFKGLNPEKFKEKMSKPVVIDGRRIFDAETFDGTGVLYLPIGRFRKGL
ncbi:MAG: UDP-glucose/GDP-mannose dehydrogenase family protein [Conexivisphaerales archaeon]